MNNTQTIQQLLDGTLTAAQANDALSSLSMNEKAKVVYSMDLTSAQIRQVYIALDIKYIPPVK